MHKLKCKSCGNNFFVKFLSRTKGRMYCGLKCSSTEKTVTHGHSRSSRSRTYASWAEMKTRCFNKKREKWERYGGRGITVCNRWMKFENFLSDMGERPTNKTLDRINNDGNYEPKNCRWATRQEQRLNSSHIVFITYKGKTKYMAQWARELGINVPTIIKRMEKTNDPEKILSKKRQTFI